MHLLTLNAAGKPLAAPRTLAPSRRRLSQVIGRHVDRSRPYMIAVQRARDPLQPIEEAWVTRGRDRHGNVRPWPRRYLPADAIVVVVYLPRGGGGGASGGSKKSPLSIALGIAAVALVAFAGPLGVAAAGALSLGATAGTFITAGLVLGGTALLSLASRAKANKTPTDTTQIYGVTGGGNAPRPGDRIPKPYGRSWIKPDLSQPDFSQYDGDDQILFKRQTIGLGRTRVYQMRVGKQAIWAEGQGFLAPFDDARNAVEFVYGVASTLVPNSNVSATGVGGALPRPGEFPSVAGPFLINQRGALVSRLQVDFQFPQGIARTDFLKSGATRANQPGAWAVLFEYAAIDEAGAIVGPWQVLYNGNSSAEGARFATHPLRYTRFKDVPPGRYAVRGRNVQPDTSNNTSGNATIDAAQWDAASGWVADTAIRLGVSEVCLRLYATKGSQAAAFGELEVDAAAIIPVWTGNQWVEQETSKAVWAFVDIMRNQDYGGALPDSQIDLGTALGYAANLTEFDTFDGLIRGPISVFEAAATVLLPMRAEPVHLGRYWSLVRDEPKAVRRHVITPRQMTKGSTQLVFDLDTASGAGHVIGEFDQDGDYRNPNQTTAIYGEASLTPTRQRWTGVRTYAHAQHLTRWRAAAGAFRRQTAPFGVEMEGRIYKRGDSILVDPWFIDARRRAGVTDNQGDTLSLDADITVQTGEAAIFRDRTGRAWGPVTLLTQASPRELRLDPASRRAVESATGQSLASVLSDGRGEMTTVLVGPVATLAENYLIQSVKPSGPDKAQVEALIDDPRVWAAIGAPIVIPPEGSAGLSDPESPRIVGLTANATPVAAGFRCDYAITPGRGAVRFEIGLSYDDGNRFDTRPDAPITGSLDLNPVDPTLIVLRARAFGATGIPGPYFLAELALPRATLNAEIPPIDYDAMAEDVRGRLDQIAGIVAKADAIVSQAQQDYASAQARADEIEADAKVAYEDAKGRAQTALDRALESLGASATNATAILDEATTRKTADELQVQRTTALIAQTDQDRALVLAEQTARINADEVFSSAFEVVRANIGANAADILSERTARVTADSAQATRLDGLDVAFAGNTAAIVAESTARANDSEVFSNAFTIVRGQIGDNSAAIANERTARISDSSVFSSAFESVTATIGQNSADIISERTARIDADTTQATRIDGISVKADNAAAAVVAETNARISDSGVFSDAFSVVRASLGANSAAITAETQARVHDSEVFSGAFQVVTARIAGAEASIASETQARISDSGVFSSAFQGVFGRLGTNEAAIADERTARISDSAVFSGAFTDVFARTDAGTASGRFSLVAQSGPAGVSARIQALVAVQSGGQTRGAGYYVDVRDDGTSRFVIDANAFYITSNGSSVPLLSFDGFTLRVPNLILTAPNVPAGVANVPARFDATNYVLIAQAGQVFEAVDANMVTTINVDNNVYPTVVSLFGTMTLDPQTNMSAMYIRIDGKKVTPIIITGTSGVIGLAAGTQGAAQTFTFSATAVVFLGAGSHEARFQYNYSGGSTSKVTINEIHLAATTPRA